MTTRRLAHGAEIDGFRLGECIHKGAMGRIYRVSHPDRSTPMVMKVPRFGSDEGAENLISFETEASILPALSGPSVPRFVAAGDITRIPYLVLEWIEDESLEQTLKRGQLRADEVSRLGA